MRSKCMKPDTEMEQVDRDLLVRQVQWKEEFFSF